MKYISLLALLLFCTPALADKFYTQEEASTICASSVNKMLDDLGELVSEGYNAEQLKAAVGTKDKEMLIQIRLFIDQVVNKETEKATATLLQIHRICTIKLSNLED